MKEIYVGPKQENRALNLLVAAGVPLGGILAGIIIDFLYFKSTILMQAIEYVNSVRPQ